MATRTSRLFVAIALGALSVASLPPSASAQTSQFYSPPKIIRQGTNTSAVVGTGSVQLKVFVHKNGSVGTVDIEKSTNHGDNAAATEIAKTSTYKPGARDGKPIDAYYTLALKFKGSAVQANTGGSGEMGQATALIRAGKYQDAKTQLQAYLTGHPDDRDAQTMLGVADSYLNDNAGATAAFDAAGSIPDRYKVVAAKAYADGAVEALKAKNNEQAIALSNKALALQANVNTLFIQGTAYGNAQNYPQAIAALEKAKAQATAGHADAATLNAIDGSLATSYIFGGQTDKGVALAQDLKRRDPSNTRIDDTLAAYYNQQAVAAVKAGNKAAAVTDLESAAKAVPSKAVVLYVQAANVLSQGTTVDWKAVKAEADKALAIDANDARANYVAGIALANQSDSKGAIPYLQKAKANMGSDASLGVDIDAALKKLGAAPK
ncbi:MAG: tetratricopeptide repeat protein [Candidatus Elarobacter sp.]